MKKVIRTFITSMICIWIIGGSFTFATETETTDKEVISEVVEDDKSDKVVKTTVSEKLIETNFPSKEYQIEGEEKNHYLVEGGNEKAVNTLATEQNIAKGSVVESVNVEGEPYDMEILDDETLDSMKALELRQFISFETKSGKVFHLIIDHSKDGDNVMMLTEVGEQDLLNMIEEQAEVELELSEKVPEANEEVVKEKQKTVEVSEKAVVSEETSKKEIDIDLIIIGAVAVLGGIGGWYFKIFKPKREALYDDEIDEAEYLDDEEYLDDTDYLDDDK